MDDQALRIVVIGGGITGAAAASALARAGHAVTLLDRRGIAAMASGWTLGGVRQSGRDPAELPLASAAVALWGELHRALGADVEYRRQGNLRLARTPDEAEAIRALVETQRARGLDLRFLPDNAAVRTVAPAISHRVLAASFCPTDGHADPVLATEAFARDAARHGAVLRTGLAAQAIAVDDHRVRGVVTADGMLPADRVIVAAGINTPALLAPLGLALPLSIKVVHVVQSEPVEPCLPPVFGVANADCAGRQEAGGRLRYTSGVRDWTGDPQAWTEEALAPTPADIRAVVERVAEVLPVAGTTAIARTWAGLIDLTPDALPVIDAPAGVAGMVVAAGFSGHGFCLGPISGQLCADLALERRPRLDLAAFRLDRFNWPACGRADLTLHG
jgi:sarcosine oxidase subunit beta